MIFLKIMCMALVLSSQGFADELILSKQEAKIRGYKTIVLPGNSLANTDPPWEKHSLDWPVSFSDDDDPIGNDMVQYQDYGLEYYHGGQDIVSEAGEWVTSPVDGILQAGHYSYSANENGELTKHWIEWPGEGAQMYFEIAVISEDFRFEFHHVDRASLPQEISDKLNEGDQYVEVGTRLGRVIPWGNDYDHIHYNIIAPDGRTRINGEWYSSELPDEIPPQVDKVFAVKPDGSFEVFAGGELDFQPTEFVVVTKDQRSLDGYEHPPAWIYYEHEDAMQAEGWNFSQMLTTEDGEWPDLRDYYRMSIGSYETWGEYGQGEFLVRLAVRDNGAGSFEIFVGDINGNMTSIKGVIR